MIINSILWTIQILLAIFFFMTGLGKIRKTPQQHIEDGHIKPGASVLPLRLLGVLECLGCIGIVLPLLINVVPILTPVSAICFCLLMIAAFIVHLRREQYKFIVLPVIVIILSLFVAYFRLMQLIQ